MVTTSGMGAGGTASNIVTLSRAIAVAYRRAGIIGPDSDIYVTVDSGRHWYVTALPGTVQRVGSVLGGPNKNNTVLRSLFESVSSSSPSGEKHTYKSLNGGRSWSLV